VAAEQAGRNTLILDLDDKGSAEAAYQLREAETPRLVRIGLWKLPVAMTAAKSGGYDLVIIDTLRRDDPSVNVSVRAAHFVVIPSRPTPVDLQATPHTVATVTRLEKAAVFVLSQTSPRGERVREAEAGLTTLCVAYPVQIVARGLPGCTRRGLGRARIRPPGEGVGGDRPALAMDDNEDGEDDP
jgi:chromosome partitioning protein